MSEEPVVDVRMALGMARDVDLNSEYAQNKLGRIIQQHQMYEALVASQNRDMDFLTHKFTQLEHNIHATHRSLAWRIGWTLMCLRAKLLRKPLPTSALDACNPVFDAIEHWKLTRD